MMMTGIEPMGLGTDRRTFECDQCGHEEELLVKFWWAAARLSAARWEVAMLRIIQANDLALKLNVLVVCAVFVFVGVVLLGAFWVQEADDNTKSIMPGDGWTIRCW
jgi:hypothetical protein